jgi:hypothetical protein
MAHVTGWQTIFFVLSVRAISGSITNKRVSVTNSIRTSNSIAFDLLKKFQKNLNFKKMPSLEKIIIFYYRNRFAIFFIFSISTMLHAITLILNGNANTWCTLKFGGLIALSSLFNNFYSGSDTFAQIIAFIAVIITISFIVAD